MTAGLAPATTGMMTESEVAGEIYHLLSLSLRVPLLTRLEEAGEMTTRTDDETMTGIDMTGSDPPGKI